MFHLVSNAFSHSHSHHQHLLQPAEQKSFGSEICTERNKDESDNRASRGQNVPESERTQRDLEASSLALSYIDGGNFWKLKLFVYENNTKYYSSLLEEELTARDGSVVSASVSRVLSAGLQRSTRLAPESESGPREQHLPPPEEQTAHVLLLQTHTPKYIYLSVITNATSMTQPDCNRDKEFTWTDADVLSSLPVAQVVATL